MNGVIATEWWMGCRFYEREREKMREELEDFRTMDDFDVEGKTVLFRGDLNSDRRECENDT